MVLFLSSFINIFPGNREEYVLAWIIQAVFCEFIDIIMIKS